MTIPASIATGGHATDAELVDAQSAILALLGVFASDILGVANGGTGIASYTAGDILYASAAAVLSKLAKGSATQVLHSGTTPLWAAVSMTADVSGTLPEGNGGTNQATYTQGDTLYASASNTLSKLAKGATGALLQQTSTIPQWYATPYLAATDASGLSFTSGSYQVVKYATVTTDTDSAYSATTGQFTVPTGKGGHYAVSAAITWGSAITGTDEEITIFIAGTQKRSVQAVNPAAAQSMIISALVLVVAGDTIDIRVFQNSGASKSLATSATFNFFNIKQVG